MSKQTTTFSVLLLTLLFVASAGYLIHSRWTRMRLLPSALRYLPPETNVLVGAGDIASLWEGMEFHFGRVIRETERKGALATTFSEIKTRIEKHQLRVQRKEDLICRYGIDIDRGVLVGLSLREVALTAVIPVARDEAVFDKYCHSSSRKASGLPESKPHTVSEEELVRFLCAFFCSQGSTPILLRHQIKARHDPCNPSILLAEGRDDRSWILEDHAYDLGRWLLVFPRPDTAILSRSCTFLKRGLDEQERNLSYARADDALFEAVRYQLRRPLLSGPGALVHIRRVASEFTPAATAAVAINLVPDAVVGDLKLRTARVNARVAEDLLAAPSAERSWREFFGAEDAAVLVLRDDSMRRYLDFASNDPDFDAELRQFLGGVLVPARRLKRLDQIVLAGTDYRDGLPLLLLGLWSSQEELAPMVRKTQRLLYQAREEKLIEGARLQGDELKRAPLTPESFNGREYLETYGGHQIRYLEPPVTEADLKYRLSGVVDPDERRILLENRYRLASTLTGDVLWVSTGKQPLLRMLSRLDGGGEAPQGFSLGVESDGQENKLRVLANGAVLIRKGMLSGESKLQDITERVLLDFRYHREVVLALRPTGNEREMRIEFTAHGPESVARPPAVPSPLGEAPVE